MNYSVSVNGSAVKTRSCKIFPAPYNSESTMEYVLLEADGEKEITVRSGEEIKSAVIRPLSAKIHYELKDGEVHIYLDCPVKISLEINGSSKNNLMIFSHKTVKPQLDENSIVINKGAEHTGTITVDKDNTTIYLEDGATLYGNIYAENCSNLTICGTGRICMERYTYEMRKNFARSIDLFNCKNVVIRDIIVDDSNDWSIRLNGCDNVTAENIKIFGCRGNSDGIDVCGSRNVTVSDIFTRVWDDSFVVKSLGTGNSENILFKDSVLWNDFARPIEVGVELRADRVKNIRFENIDIIHSSTGYPVMGIHHGDHAEVSDIVFDNIRIEDAPGAQLFDIRIADSVWSRDNDMGSIHDITFSNVKYIGADDSGVLLSNSRIEGFSKEHDVKNVSFKNISIKGRAVKTARELGLDVYDYVSGVTVESDEETEAAVLSCRMELDGNISGRVILENNTQVRLAGTAQLAVSPKNAAAEKSLDYDLKPGERAEYAFCADVQPGRYVVYLKDEKHQLENTWVYAEVSAEICEDISECPVYRFVNYYGIEDAAVRISAEDDKLLIKNESQEKTDFTVYTAMPSEPFDGEVVFSAEETDFGEVCAVVRKGEGYAAAPQLRCPLEITYVFKNEPRVKEIVKTEISLCGGETAELAFNKIGIDSKAEELWLEIAAHTDSTANLRYPYTLFRSTMPEKTAHMFGKIKIKKGDNKQC